jgi:signal transduction histidine kinase/DNA-binding response OmpR family regulator
MKYILVALLLCSSTIFAQNATYEVSITSYTQENGLSNNDVLSINKDARGVLWVGTRYGLNRFDGRNFRIFTTEQGLISNFISGIFRLDERYLLLGLGTISTDAERHFSRCQIFDTHRNEVGTLKQLFTNLPFDEKEVQYINYLQNGFLFVLQNGKKYFLSNQQEWIKIDFLKKGQRLIAFQPKKYAWALVMKGLEPTLLKYDFAGKLIQKVTLPDMQDEVKWLHTTPEGDYFAALTRTFELQIISPRTDGIVRIAVPLQTADAKAYFSRQKVTTHLTHNPLGGYWLLDPKQGVLLSEQGKPLWSIPNFSNYFTSFGAQNYFEDGIIWQCGNKGLTCIKLSKKHFKVLFETEEEGFRNIMRVGNRLFFSTRNRLYQKQNTETSVFLERSSLSGVAETDSTAWFGRFKELWSIHLHTKKIEQYDVDENELWSVWLDAERKLWFSENGAHCFNTRTKQIEAVSHQGFEELQKSTVYYFYPISKTRAWLCTTTGLYELDTRRKKILKRYWSGGKGEFYLPTDDLRHLYQDKKTGEAWVATGQSGLLRWQPKSGASELFPFNSLSTNIMHGVYADNYGFLWLPTDDGIVQWQRKTGRFRVYRTQDGLLTNEFNRISHFQDTDGTLYFGSVRGVAVFHPRDFQEVFKRGLQRPPIIVEVQQYNGSKNKVEEKTADFLAQQSLTLNPSDRFFTLTLASPDYSTSKAATYLYQIKGDAIWQKAESNQLTFWRLPYGRQTIFIKAELPDGDFSEVSMVNIFAKPPFYMRWWFVLLVASVVALAFYLRFKALQAQNAHLEEEVERRTEQIKQQSEELRQLDEMKSRFFANISHELRTPLTLIASPLERLTRQETDLEKKQFLYFAAKNSQRLLRLVNEILDLTKLEAAKLTIETEKVQVVYFVRRILAEFDSFAAHKGVQLHLKTDLTEDMTTVFDVKKVETILYNFISNALKFTPAGGKVVLSLSKNGTGLAFEVTDTGRGIAPEDLPHIFERFYQSKIQKAAEGGTGIGLALCHELAQLLGGKIEARSETGAGANFVFSLPCQLERAEIVLDLKVDNLTSSSSAEAEQDEDLPHLLLVEDNEDLQRYISVLLQKDYRLTIVNNGKIALDYLNNCTAENRPALIISDIMMPEMDGLQLLQHLKNTAAYRLIPIIMLTARAGTDDKIAALRIGVDDYLTKPFLEEELKARIQNLIERANLRKQFKSLVFETEISQENNALPQADTKIETTEELPNAEWLAALETYILKHLSDPTFSVTTAAEAFEMSRFKFTRAVSLAVGMTALDYITEIRLNEARRILNLNSNLSVREVGVAVGLTNTKLFSRKFQQRFGVYPSQV